MASSKLLDPAFVAECWTHDPRHSPTHIRWRNRPRFHFQSSQAWGYFNAKYAGQPAGNWNTGTKAYHVEVSKEGTRYVVPIHRVIWCLIHGKWPPDEIDHIDRDRSNNELGNLREATKPQNMQNRPIQRNNTSKYRGICWFEPKKKYQGRLFKNGKCVFCRYHEDPAVLNEILEAERKRRFPFYNQISCMKAGMPVEDA